MNEVFVHGLMITIIGMGLVFVVIIFLWWLMGLLVKVTTPKTKALMIDAPAEEAGLEPLVPKMADIEKQRQAAAVAVAVGLALAQQRTQLASGESQAGMRVMNPWQSMHRVRQLGQLHKRG